MKAENCEPSHLVAAQKGLLSEPRGAHEARENGDNLHVPLRAEKPLRRRNKRRILVGISLSVLERLGLIPQSVSFFFIDLLKAPSGALQ